MRAPAVRVPVPAGHATDHPAPPAVLVHLPVGDPPARLDALRRRVARLARQAGVTVVLADVIPEFPTLVQRLLPDGAALGPLLREARTHALEGHAARLRRAGVPTATVLLEGSPAVALVQEQRRGDYRLLVAAVPMPGVDDDAARAARRLARQLVRKATSPVRLVRVDDDPSPPPRLRRRGAPPRVVAAIDAIAGDDGSSPQARTLTDLARRILEEAAAQAAAAGATLHVAHAWQAAGENLLRSRRMGGHVTDADIARYRAGVHDEARAAVDTVLGACTPALPLPVAAVAMVEGEPTEALCECIADAPTDALVVGTVARAGLAGLLLGNTADELIAVAPCDLVVVKPAGFVSPVAAPAPTPDLAAPQPAPSAASR